MLKAFCSVVRAFKGVFIVVLYSHYCRQLVYKRIGMNNQFRWHAVIDSVAVDY